MPSALRTTGNIIAFLLAVFYVVAGQAHFTDRFTPGMAAQANEMTPNLQRALRLENVIDFDNVSVVTPPEIMHALTRISSQNSSAFATSSMSRYFRGDRHVVLVS